MRERRRAAERPTPVIDEEGQEQVAAHTRPERAATLLALQGAAGNRATGTFISRLAVNASSPRAQRAYDEDDMLYGALPDAGTSEYARTPSSVGGPGRAYDDLSDMLYTRTPLFADATRTGGGEVADNEYAYLEPTGGEGGAGSENLYTEFDPLRAGRGSDQGSGEQTGANLYAPFEPHRAGSAPRTGSDAPSLRERVKYKELKQRDVGYAGEQYGSGEFVEGVYKAVLPMYLYKRRLIEGYKPEDFSDTAAGFAKLKEALASGSLSRDAMKIVESPETRRGVLMQEMGWKEDDLDKAEEAKVTYLSDEEEREGYELKGGATLTRGDQPFDTTQPEPMYSKFSGPGFGIYVMDDHGRIYAGSHKVGLFHHSSFLGGEDVAGGGELKVKAGKLDTITNKSGHYLPGMPQTVQVLRELKGRGTPLAGVTLKYTPDGRDWETHDAAEWLDDHAGAVPEVRDDELLTIDQTGEADDDTDDTGVVSYTTSQRPTGGSGAPVEEDDDPVPYSTD